jgi:phage terminase small subunit
MATLTAKQQRFCEEYLIDLNATQAAIRAGYSEKRAAEIGYQLLHKTTVSAQIQLLRSERSQRTAITADKVLDDIARIGKKAEDAEEYTAALKACELTGKHLGMFKDSAAVNINIHAHEDALRELESNE